MHQPKTTNMGLVLFSSVIRITHPFLIAYLFNAFNSLFFSLSFACVVFAGLGFAIGLISQRGIRSTAVILCLLLGTVYWLSYVGASSYALTGGAAPWIGVWAPNFVFAALSVWLYQRFAKK